MGVILFVVLAGAVAFLWTRVDRLERELREWQWRADAPVEPQPVFATEAEVSPTVETASKPQPAARKSSQEIPPAETVDISQRVPDERRGAAVQQSQVAQSIAAVTEDQVERANRFKLDFDFEEIFGRLLPIWAGGIALAVAGFFLVRYSIEAGLLTPPVRVALSFLFGTALLAGAELAYRFERIVADERVRQALAGAGLATLYAGFYLGGSHYGLIGTTFSFLGLAAVTAAAIALSFRFGLPSAILGLVGGFAAPLLVGGEEANVPLLAIYLALVTAGLTYTGRQQHRSWLALAALAGGLGWGVLLLISGATGSADTVALGGYLVLLGAILPAFTAKAEGPRWVRIGAAGLASLQLAAMVGQAGFSLLSWSLYLLIGAALAFFAWREPRMREASAVAGAIGLGLASLWIEPDVAQFAIAMTGMTAIFALVPLAHIWRDRARLVDVLQLAGFALVGAAVAYWHFQYDDVQAGLALVLLGFALLPALGAWLRWKPSGEVLELDTLVPFGAAAVLVFVAGLVATPVWAAPVVGAAVTLAILALERMRGERRLLDFAWAGALVSLAATVPWHGLDGEMLALIGGGSEHDLLRSPIRWAAAFLPFLWLAMRESEPVGRRAAQLFGASAIYAFGAQVLPGDALAWFAALVGAALLALRPRWRTARAVMLGILTLWSLPVLVPWMAQGAEALAGSAMMVADTGILRDLGLYLLPLIVFGAATLLRSPDRGKLFAGAMAASGVAAMCGLHLLFKQALAIDSDAAFVSLGVIERSLWQALLLGLAAAVWRFARAQSWSTFAAAGLLLAALAHFAIFSLGWHNPLWDRQAVGALPLANLLVPAYATGLVGLAALRRGVEIRLPALRRAVDAAIMLVIGFFALSELRHAFAGSILVGTPVAQFEDVLRSVLGIVLAIGFLLWGTRTGERSWRIGSLVLMLLAVFKVFFIDASGLEGLARIASFMALGFSLIGIGWFYSRQLRGGPEGVIAPT